MTQTYYVLSLNKTTVQKILVCVNIKDPITKHNISIIGKKLPKAIYFGCKSETKLSDMAQNNSIAIRGKKPRYHKQYANPKLKLIHTRVEMM